MSEDEKSTLDELFALRREVKDLRAQLDKQTPAPEPSKKHATPEQLRHFAASFMDGASELLNKADQLERGEPIAQEPATDETPAPEDYNTLRKHSEKLHDEARELEDRAEQMRLEGANLFRRAEALRTGEPYEPATPAHEEPLFEAETLDPRGGLSNAAQRARKVWYMLGYLVDAGFIQMPNLDLIHDQTKARAIDHMRHVYIEIEGLLDLIAE